MKPKNKHQELIIKYSKELPEITKEQKEWAKSNLPDKYYTIKRNKFYCTECNHKWDEDKSKKKNLKCPFCGEKLKYNELFHSEFLDVSYFHIITTFKKIQVVRAFYISKLVKARKKPIYFIAEVMQYWIDKDRTDVLSLKSGMSMYYDAWVFNSDLEFRTKSFHSNYRANIYPKKIYPKKKILSVIRRNGFKSSFYGIHPVSLFEDILRSNIAETLIKTNHIDLLKLFRTKYYEIHEYWDSLKIAFRNKYNIPDYNDWFDYLYDLETFNKDIKNPVFICPKDLQAEHKKYIDEIKLKKLKAKLKEIADAELKYKTSKKDLLNTKINDGKIKLKPLQDVKRFLYLGDKLNNCLYTSNYYDKIDSLILEATYNDEVVEAIEVSISSKKIIQSRGLNNLPSKYNKEIINIVNSNMELITNNAI